MYVKASMMVSARKIIQPKTTRAKVRSIWVNSRKEGSSSFVLVVPSGREVVATVSRLSLIHI